MAQSDLTALKREVNQAIEDGNFDRADELARQLCEMQGFGTTQAMPEDFYFQLKRKAGKDMRKVNKNLVKAAIAALVLSASAVTVSAGVYHHIRETEHIDSGIVAYNSDSHGNVEVSSNGVSVSDSASMPEDSKEIDYDATKLPKERGTVSETVSSEKGKAGDVWLTKITKKEKDNDHFSSDDGVNWKREPQYYRRTECTFNDYDAALKEVDMPNIFDKAYTLKEDGTYYYNECKEDGKKGKYVPCGEQLDATFSYNKGYFSVSQDRSVDEDGTEIGERTFMVLTGDETTNKREYDSKNDLHFAMSDSKDDGKTMTTTILSFDEYDVTLQFFDLSDKEIHEILDSISVK